MKKVSVKIINMFSAFLLCVAAVCFTGCADAIVDDGTNIKSYVGKSSGTNGGTVPFSMYNDVMDFQVWTDYSAGCTTMKSNGALIITQTGAWYGVAICSNGSGNDSKSDYAIYDLSSIAKITFEAKSDTDGSVLKFSACTEDAKAYTLSTEYQTFEYDMSDADHAKTGNHYCIISLVQNDSTDSVIHYIKNIAFYDESGTEVVPEIVQ